MNRTKEELAAYVEGVTNAMEAVRDMKRVCEFWDIDAMKALELLERVFSRFIEKLEDESC